MAHKVPVAGVFFAVAFVATIVDARCHLPLELPRAKDNVAAKPARGLRREPAAITVQDLEQSVDEALALVEEHTDRDLRTVVSTIEASMNATFAAVPKNKYNSVNAKGVMHLLQRYFMRHHGWIIRGLEPVHAEPGEWEKQRHAHILQEKAPGFLDAILSQRIKGRGMSLREVAIIAATIEHLILLEAETVLEAAFDVSETSFVKPFNREKLEEIIGIYLVMLRRGTFRPGISSIDYQRLLMKTSGWVPSGSVLGETLMFSDDMVNSMAYSTRDTSNPFKERMYTFHDALLSVQVLTQEYGQFQNSECRVMKHELMELAPTGTGMIPINRFYSAKKKSGKAKFPEAVEYMDAVGILEHPDEDQNRTGRVRLANYMNGPSNCIGTSQFYSICCIDECEAIMAAFEMEIGAPEAKPMRVKEVAEQVSTDTVEGPRPIKNYLIGKLHEIAARNEGQVPLHGRMFAQWLHHAFPNECSFPHYIRNPNFMTTSFWGVGQEDESWKGDPEQHADLASIPDDYTPEQLRQIPEWHDTEELPLYSEFEEQAWTWAHVGHLEDMSTIFMHVVIILAMLTGVMRFVTLACRAASMVNNLALADRGKHAADDDDCFHDCSEGLKLPW